MPDENVQMTVDGELLRERRERRGLSRAALGGLVGRSEDWVKKIERGDRPVRSLTMLVNLGRVLGCQDVNELTRADVSVPISDGGKVTHPGVPSLRAAIHSPLFGGAGTPEDIGHLAGRVRQAWDIWHRAREQRTAVAAVLPGLIETGRATVRASEGAEKRRASVILAETYALAQQYAAHTVEPELYWVIVDRARMCAEQADDPIALASAAWIVGNGLRVAGHTEEALQMVADAADTLRPQLEGGSDRLRGMFGSLCLHAAVTAAQDGRDGDAWRWHGEADQTARALGRYAHPWTMFGQGNVSVHAVTIGADLHTPGIALQQLTTTDPASIPSLERRSRLYLDAAKAEHVRKEKASALQYLRLAYDVSPEAVRYVPSGRALAVDLKRTATGALSHVAHQLAEDIGVAA
ncbi:helix-turn-helix domain-containing protein [Streptomyces alanosinicus]|uniref:Transcriptional regulator n=1 Tax=Streptomyces alanosinicus TaxID=68171 RepID=A0A918MI91_9ACTN|nr:helix-turn-helix domain-containing protein [Streptomyces alanosinicus]GGW24477.1 transcriptional regulator [Streptomyces alanosinicus]